MTPAYAVPAEFDARRLDATRRRMLNPLLLRLYFLLKLPLALAAGVRLRALEPQRCEASVPYGWRSTNPFRSTYFAALAMAAELSTGALTLLAVRSAPASIAMLITHMEASYGKKATGTVIFTCEEGGRVFEAVAETLRTGEPAAARVRTVGRMATGEVAAEFTFTWSVKRRG